MIEIKGLSRHYKTKAGTVKALDNLNLQLESTGMVFILGKSGSGKSTLLNVLGGLDKYDSGEIIIKGKSSKNFSQSDFDSYRNTFVGFIFQDYNVLQEFTVAKNIGLALELQGKKATSKAVNDIIAQVDLQGYGGRKPSTLSGGQKQRVAIARALIKEPEIIMADEPTGALDSNTGKQVFETLKKLSKTKLVLVVSHDRENAEHYGDRIIELMDGQIVSDIKKYLAPPQRQSAGVSIVDNKIVTVKAGYNLTVDDTKVINQFLLNAKEDIVISTDAISNTKFKKLARIDDTGNKESFFDTNRTQLDIQQYDPKKFKLIGSRLPWKDSFKIGASGLKAKPIRLIFTIFLCVIAFVLFGLADTMASYNKIQAAISSIEQGGINYASFSKETYFVDENSDFVYWTEQKLREADINTLESNLDGVKFQPVYRLNNTWEDSIRFSQNIHTSSDLGSGAYGSFYRSAFSGAIELSDAQRQDLGFEMLAGRMPQANDEIVVTKYAFEHFMLGGYKENTQTASTASNKITISNENSLLNKTLTLDVQDGQQQFKIVGIIDTHLDGSRYELFKNQNDGTIFDYMLVMEFENLIKYSYHALLYTNVGFHQAMKQSQVFLSLGNEIRGYLQTVKPTLDSVNWERMAYFGKVGNLSNLDSDKIVWKNGQQKTVLGENEVVVNISAFNGKQTLVNGLYYHINFSPNEAIISILEQIQVIQPSIFDKLSQSDALFAELFPTIDYFVSYLAGLDTAVEPAQPLLKTHFEQRLELYNNGVLDLGNENDLFAKYPTVEDYEKAFEGLGGMNGYSQNPFYPHITGQSIGGDFWDIWQFVTVSKAKFEYMQIENPVFASLFPSYEFYISYILGDQFDAYEGLEGKYNHLVTKKELGDYLTKEEKSFLISFPTYESYLAAFDSVGGASGYYVNYFEADLTGSYHYDLYVKGLTDIILADDELTTMYIEYYLQDFYQEINQSEKISIVGIYVDEPSYGLLICDDGFYSQIEYMLGGDFSFAISKMPSNQEQIRAIVEFGYSEQADSRFLLKNQVTYSLQNINSLIETLADVFLYVGIGFAVFASLMMLNFIATSISYKKREVGILRAVGATGRDVFGIFFNESILITLINFAIALVGTIVVCTLLNMVLREQVGLMITLLHFGIRQIGLMLAISFLVALVSSFFPVSKISRMRPIDAIKQG